LTILKSSILSPRVIKKNTYNKPWLGASVFSSPCNRDCWRGHLRNVTKNMLRNLWGLHRIGRKGKLNKQAPGWENTGAIVPSTETGRASLPCRQGATLALVWDDRVSRDTLRRAGSAVHLQRGEEKEEWSLDASVELGCRFFPSRTQHKFSNQVSLKEVVEWLEEEWSFRLAGSAVYCWASSQVSFMTPNCRWSYFDYNEVFFLHQNDSAFNLVALHSWYNERVRLGCVTSSCSGWTLNWRREETDHVWKHFQGLRLRGAPTQGQFSPLAGGTDVRLKHITRVALHSLTDVTSTPGHL